jgi:transcriptional regulator with XRE-family HTH domain
VSKLSTVISEKSNKITEGRFAIVPASPKSENEPMASSSNNALADYVLRVMRESGLTFPEVERIARKRGGTIGKSTVQQIASGKTPNPGIFTLRDLAWGLGRPFEEVIRNTVGDMPSEGGAFQKSELANIGEMSKSLPLAEQRMFKRYLQMIEREMLRLLSSE